VKTPIRTIGKRREYSPPREELAFARDQVSRCLTVRIDTRVLDEKEQRQLVGLVRKASAGGEGGIGWNVLILDKGERKTLERLVEKAAGLGEGFYAEQRRQAEWKDTLAQMAQRAMRPPRKPALLPSGSVVFGADLWAQLTHEGGTILGFEECGVLLVAAAALENAGSLGPHSRIELEDGEPVLVLHASFGFGVKLDLDQRLNSAWVRALDQVAAAGWLRVEKTGHEIRVQRGVRLKRAADGGAT
jgi:hypothetical protein